MKVLQLIAVLCTYVYADETTCEDDPDFVFTNDNGKERKCENVKPKFCSNSTIAEACRKSCTECVEPSINPSTTPSTIPSVTVSLEPSVSPTMSPTFLSSTVPSIVPSVVPSYIPSLELSALPTTSPSISIACEDDPDFVFTNDNGKERNCENVKPKFCSNSTIAEACRKSCTECVEPTINPSTTPSTIPSITVSLEPSVSPTMSPTLLSSTVPSAVSSTVPSIVPSVVPSFIPSLELSALPTTSPSIIIACEDDPDFVFTNDNGKERKCENVKPKFCSNSTIAEACRKSCTECVEPTINPSTTPSTIPSVTVSLEPSVSPTSSPSTIPTLMPSTQPYSLPSTTPTGKPSIATTTSPSGSPSADLSVEPSTYPSIKPTLSPSKTSSETPSLTPSSSPTKFCFDDSDFLLDNIEEKTCKWISSNEQRRNNLCGRLDVRVSCPFTCGMCCQDKASFRFRKNADDERPRKCAWIYRTKKFQFCKNDADSGFLVEDFCPVSCDICKTPYEYDPSDYPTTSPSTIQTTVPTKIPSKLPSETPSPTETCGDDPFFNFKGDSKDCFDLYGRTSPQKYEKFCSWNNVKTNCRSACGVCCGDNIMFTYGPGETKTKTCESLANETETLRSRYCTPGSWIARNCPSSCGIC